MCSFISGNSLIVSISQILIYCWLTVQALTALTMKIRVINRFRESAVVLEFPNMKRGSMLRNGTASEWNCSRNGKRSGNGMVLGVESNTVFKAYTLLPRVWPTPCNFSQMEPYKALLTSGKSSPSLGTGLWFRGLLPSVGPNVQSSQS